MSANASRQLARMLTRLGRQRQARKALMHQVVTCLWWLDKRIAPSSGGDAA
jgi:hypothetical protein